jgi:hypothetical protein
MILRVVIQMIITMNIKGVKNNKKRKENNLLKKNNKKVKVKNLNLKENKHHNNKRKKTKV